ncbi:hypothetical protein ABEV40_08670, partial [Geobacillus thermocatenulatus]|uniref:hypothetical protein n=1 Tax=Geobacillus thermocatenulatus TaxID=33938 RepID=UPI003D1E2F9B
MRNVSCMTAGRSNINQVMESDGNGFLDQRRGSIGGCQHPLQTLSEVRLKKIPYHHTQNEPDSL